MHDKSRESPLVDILKKGKVRNLVLLLGVVGIALIYISTWFGSSPEKAETTPPPAEFSAEEYEERLEKNLKEIVSAITGEANPAVMVTLESTGRVLYAADEKKSAKGDGSEEETVPVLLKDAQGAQHALTVTEMQPKIKGVVVVSKYAENPIIQEKITLAMKIALDISSARVCVTGGG